MKEKENPSKQDFGNLENLSSDECELLCLFAMMDESRQKELLHTLRHMLQEMAPWNEDERGGGERA